MNPQLSTIELLGTVKEIRPEYLVWPVVCRHEGKYKSLCLNLRKESAYRCCGHCERTLEKLGANNVQIDDLWETAFLCTEQGSDEEPYPYREPEEASGYYEAV